jgi:adenylate cyclase, class 2
MTTPTNIETEVKLYTPDHAPIVQKLGSLGAQLIYPRVLEKNLRYDNTDGGLVQRGVVLRLRQDSRVRMTYKDGGTLQDGIVTRQEIEVDVDNLQNMQLILENLGFYVYLTYEKYRTTYEFYGAEIVIDELPYGNFVEIEGEQATIEDIIRILGLQGAIRVPESYTRLFVSLKERLALPFEHLTFTNFENVVIPPATLETILREQQ